MSSSKTPDACLLQFSVLAIVVQQRLQQSLSCGKDELAQLSCTGATTCTWRPPANACTLHWTLNLQALARLMHAGVHYAITILHAQAASTRPAAPPPPEASKNGLEWFLSGDLPCKKWQQLDCCCCCRRSTIAFGYTVWNI